jgi:hypothetical protein
LAVRDPGCPQAPVPARARRLPALMRGSSCGWLRPRPPIPGRATHSQHPARRVARQPGKGHGQHRDPGLVRELPGSSRLKGSPSTSRTSQAAPTLVKASAAQIATGVNLAGRSRSLDQDLSGPAGPSSDPSISPLGWSAPGRSAWWCAGRRGRRLPGHPAAAPRHQGRR